MMKIAPDRLRCEFLVNPVGMETRDPGFSWQIPFPTQHAYRIQVATSPEFECEPVWDSGKAESSRQIDIRWQGRELRSRERMFWRVKIWDEAGRESQWSDPAFFEMGLMKSSDWEARWISGPAVGGKTLPGPCPLLRKSFPVKKPVASARLYLTALGLVECSINGNPVSEDLFSPGWTDYKKRVQYRVYDVSELLIAGENVLGAVLGDGWYCGHVAWFERQTYGTHPAVLAQLEVFYQDGTSQRIVSDGSWKSAFGNITGADIQMGQHEDARLRRDGWDVPGFDDSRWAFAEDFCAPTIELSPTLSPPVRATQTVSPTDIRRLPDDVGVARWLVDFGQNLVGVVRVKLRGESGDWVAIFHGEVLDAAGNLYLQNLRGAQQRDTYILRGDAEGETFFPRFTFHGFRYVEIRVSPARIPRRCVLGTPAPSTVQWQPCTSNLEAVVFHSALSPTGNFSCSDNRINRLQSNIQWGQRGNFVDVPTDCPQRNERLGWTGDAQVFCSTAAFNMDVCAFFRKWMRDLRDGQLSNGDFPKVAPNVLDDAAPEDLGCHGGGPAWSDAAIIVPWTIHRRYGDTRILEENYESMVRFLEFLQRKCPACIHPSEGFGDWLSTDGASPMEALTPKDLIGTAFFAWDAKLLAEIASVLGKTEDAHRHLSLFEKVRSAFQKKYLSPDGMLSDGTQTACVLALAFDLLPEASLPIVLDHLVSDIASRGNRLSTGFVGTPYLNPVLSKFGGHDTACQLLLQTRWPSWLYPIVHADATTIWERWDGWTDDRGFQDPSMNSFNHYAYGAIGEWLYETIAGIRMTENEKGVAFQNVEIAPKPGAGLTSACAELQTPFGLLQSSWHVENRKFFLEVHIPYGTSARVELPSGQSFDATPGSHSFEEPI